MQGGKVYNRWYAYGQSKTANMLFAISLAQKLGMKYNLQAYSLHPGVIWTNLGGHLDWSVEFTELSRCRWIHFCLITQLIDINRQRRQIFGQPGGLEGV